MDESGNGGDQEFDLETFKTRISPEDARVIIKKADKFHELFEAQSWGYLGKVGRAPDIVEESEEMDSVPLTELIKKATDSTESDWESDYDGYFSLFNYLLEQLKDVFGGHYRDQLFAELLGFPTELLPKVKDKLDQMGHFFQDKIATFSQAQFNDAGSRRDEYSTKDGETLSQIILSSEQSDWEREQERYYGLLSAASPRLLKQMRGEEL